MSKPRWRIKTPYTNRKVSSPPTLRSRWSARTMGSSRRRRLRKRGDKELKERSKHVMEACSLYLVAKRRDGASGALSHRRVIVCPREAR